MSTQQSDQTSSDDPQPGSVVELVKKLKKKIYDSRPIFGRIIERHGAKSIYEYSKDFFSIQKDTNLDARRPICLNIIHDELEKRLGKKVAHEVQRQLLQRPLVNTTDHHAIIDHPFWLNVNLVTSLAYEELHIRSMKYLIVFSFASVSLNNASGFPRGILFHGGEHGEGPLIRIAILPDKWKMRTVYGTPAYTQHDLENAKKQLHIKVKEGLVGVSRAAHIEEKVIGLLERKDILNSEDFSSQITKINFELWPQYFSGNTVPGLVYLEAETITREILIQEVLLDETCLLNKMLFDEYVQNIFIRYFQGLPGTFSRPDDVENWGTYFFWGFDEKFHRIKLSIKDKKLVSEDGRYSIPLTPESISIALKEKKLLPSMITVYLTLSLHYGFKCLGGFSQVHDLTKMKEALLHVLVELGKFKEIHSVCRIQTKELSGDGLVLAYSENDKKELVPATGIDLLLNEKKMSYHDYIALSKEFSLEEMIGPLLPEMYTVLYPSYMRTGSEEEKLTPEKIMVGSGLQNKMEGLFRDISQNHHV